MARVAFAIERDSAPAAPAPGSASPRPGQHAVRSPAGSGSCQSTVVHRQRRPARRRRHPGRGAQPHARLHCPPPRKTASSTDDDLGPCGPPPSKATRRQVLAAIKTARAATWWTARSRRWPGRRSAWRPSSRAWIALEGADRPAADQFQTAMPAQEYPGSVGAARARHARRVPVLIRERVWSSGRLRMGACARLAWCWAPAFGGLAGEAWLRAGQPWPPSRRWSRPRRREAAMPAVPARAAPMPDRRRRQGPAGPHALSMALTPGGPALAAGVYATYSRHVGAIDAATIAANRTPGPHLGPRLR